MKLVRGLLGALLCGTACYPSVAHEPRTSGVPAQVALPRAARNSIAMHTGANPDDPAQEFIVLMQNGQIVLRSRSAPETRVLAPHADDALYHATLELIWFKDGDRLSVIDLRALDTPPVVIALGMENAEGKLSIVHPPVSAQSEDGCDVPMIRLNWTEKPTIELGKPDAGTDGLRIVNAAWLHKEFDRSPRQAAKRREPGQPHLPLPKSVLHCQETDECGATVSFGARGLQLVTVLQKMGGDCWQRSCLVRDPHTDSFATPPRLNAWSSAGKTKPGSCGLYLFDRDQTAFLLEHELCVPEHGCQDLGGWALGWRVPGDTVGAP